MWAPFSLATAALLFVVTPLSSDAFLPSLPSFHLARSPLPRANGLAPSWSGGGEGAESVISALRKAKDKHEIAAIVVKNVKTVAQPSFFLKIAEMADGQDDKVKRELDGLSIQVTAALEDILKMAERSMDESNALLQGIVSACAEEDGEFKLPLSEERLMGLRTALKANIVDCGDGFLTTAQAWIRKAESDGLAGMVNILQKVLQVWSAITIIRDLPVGDNPTPSMSFLLKMLEADAESWENMVKQELLKEEGGVTRDGLITAAQTAIETVVLQHANGSMIQRVQAEFVKQLCSDIEVGAGAVSFPGSSASPSN